MVQVEVQIRVARLEYCSLPRAGGHTRDCCLVRLVHGQQDFRLARMGVWEWEVLDCAHHRFVFRILRDSMPFLYRRRLHNNKLPYAYRVILYPVLIMIVR